IARQDVVAAEPIEDHRIVAWGYGHSGGLDGGHLHGRDAGCTGNQSTRDGYTCRVWQQEAELVELGVSWQLIGKDRSGELDGIRAKRHLGLDHRREAPEIGSISEQAGQLDIVQTSFLTL